MANIATVMAVTVVRASVDLRKVSPRKLLKLMTKSYGRSYCVPTWYYADASSGCIYTQHGEKWWTSGVPYAWKAYPDLIDAIWVRCNDEGADFDEISRFTGYRSFEYASTEFGAERYGRGVWQRFRLCQYGFDEILIGGLEEPSGYLAADWHLVGTAGVWGTRIKGHYCSGNLRGSCDPTRKPLTSPTTPISAQIYSDSRKFGSPPSYFWWQAAHFPRELLDIESLLYRDATHVEFRWRGRTTRLYKHLDDRWWGWCMDDWDNCIDPEWLAEDPAFLAQRDDRLFDRLRTRSSGLPFRWAQNDG